MAKAKTIVQKHTENFETLRRAFRDNAVCIMDCIEKATGEHVAVICAATRNDNNEIEFTPFARFFNGNPFEMLIPPMQENL
jgi:hypothetical protein